MIHAVARIAIPGGRAEEAAEARFPGVTETIAQLRVGRPGGDFASARVAELREGGDIEVPARGPEQTIGPQARRVHDAATGDAVVIQPQVERLEGDDLRPAAPMPDGGPQSLAFDGPVRLAEQAGQRLDR